jgi:hypothetical protein
VTHERLTQVSCPAFFKPAKGTCDDRSSREAIMKRQRRSAMAATAVPESGTKDKNYDLITVTHLCLEHVWRLDQYAQDAEREGDNELATLFRRMQEHSRKGAEECKRLLGQRLSEDK